MNTTDAWEATRLLLYSTPPTNVKSELSTTPMHKRFLATTVLATALLFSLGGNFLVAVLCPHLRSAQVSCHAPLAEPQMSHDDMADMEMDSMDESASNPDPNAIAVGEPIGLCPHCAVHSRTTPNAVSLREVGVSKRAGSFAIPDAIPNVVPVELSSLAVLTSRAHGPPRETTRRFILINIFRI